MIENFKYHIKLEFDIKTNQENINEILTVITKIICKEMNEKITDKTEIEFIPEVKIIRNYVPQFYGQKLE